MKVNGKKWLIKRAVSFASTLGVFGFDLTIIRTASNSYCMQNDDGSFTIAIDSEATKLEATQHLAHEMVHLKQYKRDELIDMSHGYTSWKGQLYPYHDPGSDEYFLSPWEMEARALEEFLVHKWETQQLH